MTSEPTRVAIVTGAARGIGEATAVRLAADGLAVAVVDLDEAACANRGPRIGSDGVPLCARLRGHDGPHMPHESWVSQITYWNDL